MSDGTVQPYQSDGGTKKIDVSEVTRSDGSVVERGRAVIGDDSDSSAQGMARVHGGALEVSESHLQLLESIDEKLGRILLVLEAAVQP